MYQQIVPTKSLVFILTILLSSTLLTQAFSLKRISAHEEDDNFTPPPNTPSQVPEIVAADITNEHVGYRLFTSINMLNMLVDHSTTFQLILKPNSTKSLESPKGLLARFHCEDSESDSFDWEEKDSGCRVLTLEPEFDFNFTSTTDQPQTINITLKSLKPGKQQLVAHTQWLNARIKGSEGLEPLLDSIKAYIHVNVGRSNTLLTISSIIGWIYFVAWSISFYPQLWYNFKRRSVVGLNFDFVALNITGFISYSMFNVSLFAIGTVQQEYMASHPRSQIPVQVNDVVFALHATFATFICIVQCLCFERGNQGLSIFTKIFLVIVWSGYLILGMLVAFTSYLTMLDYIYIFSYIKLIITIIKYIPQAYYNYQRKSTVGWSIGNIFLDFTGGFLSMCQMFMLAYNYDDWITIFNNFTKFGLGFISILFDILFMMQHYVFYPHIPGMYDSQSAIIDAMNGSVNGSINTNVSDLSKPPMKPTTKDPLYNAKTSPHIPYYHTTDKEKF